MNGNIEAAFTGKVITDPENRMSQAGNPWPKFNAAIGEGEEVQYVQVKVFGDTAAKLSGQIAKGSKVYCEGKLKLNRWEKDGQQRSGLSLAAWRCDLIGQIGKNKPPRSEGRTSFAGEIYHPSRTSPQEQTPDRFDFNDQIPFGR